MRRLIIGIIMTVGGALSLLASPEVDSIRLVIPINPEATVDTDRNWWHLLKEGELDLKDTTVVYPKFLKFCVDVYNWGDRFFNSYNTEYVEGTGHRWKARLVNDNWTDSYSMVFKDNKMTLRMLNELNVNLGAYLHYMAVSVGYSMNMSTIFKGRRNKHSRFETNFNCALFNFELSYTTNTGTFIRQLTGYNQGRLVKIPFPETSMKNLDVSIYYFFNNKKYSQGAAYNFSKFQKKSAGSWMLGFTYSNLDISMNFNDVAHEIRPFFTLQTNDLRFHYHSYCILVGYGFNWVFHPKWLFNVTAQPSIGFNHCYEDATVGEGNQFALNIHGRMSVTFNHRSFFANAMGKISGNWYTSKHLSLFNAIEYFAVNAGIRF